MQLTARDIGRSIGSSMHMNGIDLSIVIMEEVGNSLTITVILPDGLWQLPYPDALTYMSNMLVIASITNTVCAAAGWRINNPTDYTEVKILGQTVSINRQLTLTPN